MKSLKIIQYGEVDSSLEFQDGPMPEIQENEVLIKVQAAATNPIDHLLTNGFFKDSFPLQFPSGIGYDLSGVVTKKGSAVNGLEVGDKVFSRLPTVKPGSFSEYVAADSDVVAKMPENLNFELAGGMALVGLTVYQSFEQIQLKKGDHILIHAGSGGVGSFAIQYAKHIGAYVSTTTSTDNVEWVKALGADNVIDYKKENYLNVVRHMDVVYDTLGEDYTFDAFKVIKKGGRVCSLRGPLDHEVAELFGISNYQIPEALNALVQEKDAFYKFTMVHSNKEGLDVLRPIIERGAIKPIIDKVYPFSETVDAIRYQQTGRAKGKVIVKIK